MDHIITNDNHAIQNRSSVVIKNLRQKIIEGTGFGHS